MQRQHLALAFGFVCSYIIAPSVAPAEQPAPDLQAGRATYEKSCARCHGVTGQGDGLDAKRLYPQLEVLQLGRGFVKIMGDKKPFEEHVEAAQAALKLTREKITSGQYDLVILDEVNYALGYMDFKLIELEDVLEILRTKPPQTHIILTGRNAHPKVIEMADLVTEMKEIKHPMKLGIPAQQGVDY